MKLRLAIVFAVFFISISPLDAQEDIPHVSPSVQGAIALTPEQEDQYARLEALLKCPVCKNQSVASSESFLSKEIKRILRERIAAGESDEEVVAYFESRYGSWILLAPPKRGANWGLYLAPLLGVLAMGGAIFLWIRSGAHFAKSDATEPPDTTEKVEQDVHAAEAQKLIQQELNR